MPRIAIRIDRNGPSFTCICKSEHYARTTDDLVENVAAERGLKLLDQRPMVAGDVKYYEFIPPTGGNSRFAVPKEADYDPKSGKWFIPKHSVPRATFA